jgi:hypothetical protein
LAAGADGTRFHVAFAADGTGKDVFLAFVGTTGSIDAGPVNVTSTGGDQHSPAVAGVNGRAALVWRNDSSATVQGIGIVGTSTAGSSQTVSSTDNPQSPAVGCYDSSGATECVVVWQATDDGLDIRGADVSVANGGMDTPDPEDDVAVGAGDQSDPAVLATPPGYTVVYVDQPSGQDTDIRASGFLHNGTAVFTAVAVATTSANEIGPAAVSVDDSIGYAWNDSNGDILFRSSNALGLTFTTPAVVNPAANSQTDPSVAFGGTNYLVSWVDGRGDIYSTLVSTLGVVALPDGIVFVSAGADSAPTSCSNGT